MKRCRFLLVMMATTIAFAPAAIAQHWPPTCDPLPQDRTITFCYPIDAGDKRPAIRWLESAYEQGCSIMLSLALPQFERTSLRTSVSSAGSKGGTATSCSMRLGGRWEGHHAITPK